MISAVCPRMRRLIEASVWPVAVETFTPVRLGSRKPMLAAFWMASRAAGLGFALDHAPVDSIRGGLPVASGAPPDDPPRLLPIAPAPIGGGAVRGVGPDEASVSLGAWAGTHWPVAGSCWKPALIIASDWAKRETMDAISSGEAA